MLNVVGLYYKSYKISIRTSDCWVIHIQFRSMSRRQSQPPPDTRPIALIMGLKSNEDLRSYLEERPELNLSLLKDKNGSSLLHFASFKNQLPKMKIYILHFQAFARENLKHNRHDPSFQNQLKAWINVPNEDGITALHFAGLHGNIEMVEFLERYGANMASTTKDHEDLLFMTVQNNHLKSLAYLLEHREGKIPFNPNATNNKGDTILHKASNSGYLAIVSYLLSLPPQQVQRNTRNEEGFTPLMLAVKQGHKDIVKRMLVKGVDRDVRNLEEQKAIDIAGLMGKDELVRILRDDFSTWQKFKIACNIKLVYKVEQPTVAYAAIFLILFHILFLPSQILAEVTILQSPYYFYSLAGLFYILVMAIFVMLTKKHPKKRVKDIQEIQLPMCAECRETVRTNQFHCFICGVCVWRYDHHCPWINNCVSSLNIGKFIFFLVLLILASAEIIFMSLCLQTKAFDQIKPTTLLSIPEDTLDTIIVVNVAVCCSLGVLGTLSLFSLLGDQLKNLFSNTTSYERAKSIHKSSLLSSVGHSMNTEYDLEQDESEDGPGCMGNCCMMLKQPYVTG